MNRTFVSVFLAAAAVAASASLSSFSNGLYSPQYPRMLPSCGSCHNAQPGSTAGFQPISIDLAPAELSVTPGQSCRWHCRRPAANRVDVRWLCLRRDRRCVQRWHRLAHPRARRRNLAQQLDDAIVDLRLHRACESGRRRDHRGRQYRQRQLHPRLRRLVGVPRVRRSSDGRHPGAHVRQRDRRAAVR